MQPQFSIERYGEVEATQSAASMVCNAGARRHRPQDGYPTLERLFSSTQLLAFAITFMASWEVMAMNMGATFHNGGPQTLSWGIIVVVLGALAQASSMAELAAIQPVAGAQYYWTHHLAPDRQKRFITWIQGWVTWFAWVSALAGSTSSEGNILLGLIATNHPWYEYRPWHLTVVIIGQLIVVGLLNTFAFRAIPWLETVGAVMHVMLFIVLVVVLLTSSPRHDARFVFFGTSNDSGWHDAMVSWNLGLLVPAWGFIGFDGVVHMSEEVKKAKSAVPRAMVWTVVLNGVLAYLLVIVLLFCMGDPDEVLASPYPIIPICQHAAGRRGGTAIIVALLTVVFCVVVASLASVSRITWAWARDGGLPSWIATIHPRLQVPVYSLWVPISLVVLLSLFAAGNTSTSTVFTAFTSLSSLGLYSSYIIAIGCMIHARMTGRIAEKPPCSVQYGEWRLPRRSGLAINVFALVWTVYLTVWLPFPTTLPVSSTNMNYAGPIYVFVVLTVYLYWLFRGREGWPGLTSETIGMVSEHY